MKFILMCTYTIVNSILYLNCISLCVGDKGRIREIQKDTNLRWSGGYLSAIHKIDTNFLRFPKNHTSNCKNIIR